MLTAPVLSEWDPLEQGEGSIDPLGLAPAYERLADQVFKNVTVRMGRIRFVTAIAVGSWVCQPWEPDKRAADGISNPWQVFEWTVVMAFVKAQPADGSARPRIAGSQKVQRAMRDQFAVSAKTYLKTPTVFGFGGVFRRFAIGTHVIGRDGRLDEAGLSLVRAWAEDQNLTGFQDGTVEGPGQTLLTRLRSVVAKGLTQGFLREADLSKDLTQELVSHLDPDAIGAGRECEILRELVEAHSGEGAPFLTGELQQRKGALEPRDEPGILRPLVARAPAVLAATLRDIDAYESLCRPLTDAFDWIRFSSSEKRGVPLSPQEYRAASQSAAFVSAIAEGVRRLQLRPELLAKDRLIQDLVDRFDQVNGPVDLFDRILKFHEQIQRAKPPEGKSAWLERHKDGVVIRPGYALKDPPAPDSEYVHEYRLPTFSRFLADLGRLR